MIFPSLQTLRSRPRLIGSILAGTLLYLLLPLSIHQVTRLLIAWDTTATLYLVSAVVMMSRATIDHIRRYATLQDEGKIAMLLLTIIAAIASLGAIVAELSVAKTLPKALELQSIGLTGLTVFLSWSFLQTIFALHYAHEYYMPDKHADSKGLEFPGNTQPDYWDFVYFSFIIGTAAQTADVNITSKIIRNTATFHSVLAFFFNTVILALTINIGAGLF